MCGHTPDRNRLLPPVSYSPESRLREGRRRERGWPPATRAQFDALRGPTGALLIGDAETVAQKILYVNEILGGLGRITFQMGVSVLPHEKMLRSIELLGTRVVPIIKKEFAAEPARV